MDGLQGDTNGRQRRGPFESLSVDWTPKMTVLFSSPASFAWTDSISNEEKANLLTNLRWNDNISTEVEKSLLISCLIFIFLFSLFFLQQPEVQLLSMLRYWTYPAVQHSPSHVTRLRRLLQKGSSSVLTKEERADLEHHEKLTKHW
jgi:hypothetical protein